jgi:hypothetical protein
MPLERKSTSVKLKSYVTDFPNEGLSTDGKVIFCNVCQTTVSSSQRFLVQQHIATAKHQARNKTRKEKQLFLSDMHPDKREEFNKDLCRAFIGADIPLYKLNNPCLKQFLEQYTARSIPDQSTLRKNYAPHLYEETLANIRKEIQEKSIWVSVDETTDKEMRMIVNVVIGVMSCEPCKPILLACEVIDKCNNKTIAKVFNDAMSILWPGGIKYENVLMFLSDAAPYMLKAGEALRVIYPKMIHFTCAAHALHRCAEVIRANYPKVDLLISSIRKMFLKAPSRIKLLKDIYPDMPLPPKPIESR